MSLANSRIEIGSIAIIIGEVGHSFFGCWNGQLLINECIRLHTAV